MNAQYFYLRQKAEGLEMLWRGTCSAGNCQLLGCKGLHRQNETWKQRVPVWSRRGGWEEVLVQTQWLHLVV